jgi:hypothetical protein
MFLYMSDERVLSDVFFFSGHMEQIIESGKIGVSFDNRLRLLRLQIHEFARCNYEFIDQPLPLRAEGDLILIDLSCLSRHRSAL